MQDHDVARSRACSAGPPRRAGIWCGGLAVWMLALAVVASTQAPNTLTAAEKAAGWTLLFDGMTTSGWREFHAASFPDREWVVESGTLRHVAGPRNSTDIITTGEYENFELEMDWKIGPAGNSGIKYLISESLIATGSAGLGFEMQVLDDDRHPDAKAGTDGNRTAGSLYDLIPAVKTKRLEPVGAWNHVRVLVDHGHVEHWLNGGKVLEFDLGGDDLQARIAASKFRVNPGFGEVRRGHVLLQGHTDDAWFRNIRIRER
jgi:hypothetical protein